MTAKSITQERLKEVLFYDPRSGIFTWKMSRGTARKGAVAGVESTGGYRAIGIDGRRYSAHRLAFLYVEGSFPKDSTDHVNGKTTDDSFKNLRRVSIRTNTKNRKIRSTNKTGIHGVCWHAALLRWQVNISNESGWLYLGVFDSFFDACCARKSAELKYNYHPNHGRK